MALLLIPMTSRSRNMFSKDSPKLHHRAIACSSEIYLAMVAGFSCGSGISVQFLKEVDSNGELVPLPNLRILSHRVLLELLSFSTVCMF